jgi:hypothetical protein
MQNLDLFRQCFPDEAIREYLRSQFPDNELDLADSHVLETLRSSLRFIQNGCRPPWHPSHRILQPLRSNFYWFFKFHLRSDGLVRELLVFILEYALMVGTDLDLLVSHDDPYERFDEMVSVGD